VYARSWVNVREYLLGNVQAPQYDTVSIDFISQKRVNISHLNEIYNDPHKIPVTVWKLKWISDDNIIYIYETSTGLYSYYDLDDYVTYERILSYPPLTGMRWTYHIDMTAIIDSIYTYEYENRSYDAIVMKYRHVGDLIKGLFEGATDIWANGLGLVYRKGVAGGFAGSEQYVVEYILIDVKYRKDP